MMDIDSEYVLSLTEVDDPENHAGVRHQDGAVRETLVSNHWVDRGIWLLSSSIFQQIQEMSDSEDTHEVRMLKAIQRLIGNGTDVAAYLTYEPWIELGDHEPLKSVLKALQFFREKEGLKDSSIGSQIEVENSKIENSLVFGSGKITGSRIENSAIYLKGNLENQNLADRISAFDFDS